MILVGIDMAVFCGHTLPGPQDAASECGHIFLKRYSPKSKQFGKSSTQRYAFLRAQKSTLGTSARSPSACRAPRKAYALEKKYVYSDVHERARARNEARSARESAK